ncbi:MAG TPA: hypothetical protein PK239_05730 [Chitinophagales bacterium]|mgnify:CR=1 FL=1|nr:hypothetical protein [Chitinophagales bacterium]HRK26777.1 hypothetical protein [Chitinophagales bacterium]
MNTSALITLLLAQGIVIAFTAYFFWKVLTTPQKSEPDSYADNDNQAR